MDRVKIKEMIQQQYGNFETHLEHEYEMVLIEKLLLGKMRERRAWLTYNQVILELKNSLKNNLKVQELQYMLTENLNPNKVCIEVLEDIKNDSPELERLYIKIYGRDY